MKRTRINLLVNKRDYGKIDRYFRTLRIFVLSFTVALFLFVVSFLYLHFTQTLRLQSLIETQKDNLSLFEEQKANEVKLVYAANKINTLDRFLLEDANFYPYYDLLLGELNRNSSESAQVSSFAIDKDRHFELILSFSSFDQMISSFKLIESPDFLRNFERISLVNFQTDVETSTGYQLSFDGRFKKIQ